MQRIAGSSAVCRGTSTVLIHGNKFHYLDSVAKTHLAPEVTLFPPKKVELFSGPQGSKSHAHGPEGPVMWGKHHLPYYQMR